VGFIDRFIILILQ